MPTTEFTDAVTLSAAAWANEVNDTVFDLLGSAGTPPTTKINVLQNIQSNKAAFLAYVDTLITNVTGDATVYDIIFNNEILDRAANYNNATGLFTAPTTGYYRLWTTVSIQDLAAGHTVGSIVFVTTNRNYQVFYGNMAAIRDTTANTLTIMGSALVDMTAAHTAKVRIAITGGAKACDIGVDSKFGGELDF